MPHAALSCRRGSLQAASRQRRDNPWPPTSHQCHMLSLVSSSDASKEGGRRRWRCRHSSKAWTGFSPREPSAVRTGLQDYAAISTSKVAGISPRASHSQACTSSDQQVGDDEQSLTPFTTSQGSSRGEHPCVGGATAASPRRPAHGSPDPATGTLDA